MLLLYYIAALLLGQGHRVTAAPAVRSPIASRHLLGSSFGIPQNASYDYLVVGGGTAGLAIASRLAEKYSVAVIEAGSFYEIDNGNLSQVPALSTQFSGKDPHDTSPLIDWGFVTTPQDGLLNASVHYARGKTLGGCSARNYMAYHRSTREAYKKWADHVGDQSYTFDKWLPFFEKSLDYTPPDSSKRAVNATPRVDLKTLGKGRGPLSVTFSNYAQAASSWVEKGFEAIGIQPIDGFTSGRLLGSSYVLETINASTQTRDSSETAFLRPALGSYSLTVYQSSLAKKILFNSSKAAVGVRIDSEGLMYTLTARQEVIVSAGAFQSPQLLMVSGIGPAKILQRYKIPEIAVRPGVGQNLWDHVLMGPTWRMNLITASSLSNPTFAMEASRQFNEEQSGILTNSGGDWLAWEKIPEHLRTSFSNSTLSKLRSFPSDWPEAEYISMSGFLGYQENFQRDAPKDGYNYATVSMALVAPLSRGTVHISSADMADPPIINPNWLTDPADQEVAIAGYKRVRQMFNTSVVQPALKGSEYFPGNAVQTDAEILSLIKRTVSTVYHAAATCSMGQINDTSAVVDSKAKVIGVKGLRVVDASAFPFLPPGHPMATVYALAEKIADDILSGG